MKLFSLDDIFILYCLVNDQRIALGRILQWRIWLISDSMSGIIFIGGIVTKLAKFFHVKFDKLEAFLLFSLMMHLSKIPRNFL